MKKLVLPGVILLIVILLIGGVMGICRIMFSNRYEAEIAAIKSKGEPLTWEQLLGPPVPASQNALNVYDQIRQKTAAGVFKSSLEAAAQAVGSRRMPLDVANERKLAEAVADSRPLLDLTAQAASRPVCQVYPDPATGEPGYQHLMAVRDACKLLAARSIVHAQSGDMDAAADDVAMQFRIAAQLKGGSTFISQLIWVAMGAIAAESAQNLARYGNLSEQHARQLFDAVGSIDVAQGFRQSLLGERVHFIYMGQPTGPGGATRAIAAGRPSPGPTGASPIDSLYMNTVLRGDEAVYLRFIAGQLDGLNLSYRQAKSRRVFTVPDMPVYAIISKMLSSSFVSCGFKRFEAEEHLARTRVFLALQAYKARFGGYPASIKELKSKLGWKLPVDPFSGKDFIYKRQAKGFVLYSVGPDMKDDGGRKIAGDTVELGSKGDIVLTWDK